MKRIRLFAILLIVSIGSFVACNNDKTYVPPTAVETSFANNFPGATAPYWYGYGQYQMAIFDRADGDYTNAYFNNSGLLMLTGVEVLNGEFPAAVTTAFSNSIYGDWEILALGELSRVNMETLYVYTITSGETTFMFYYNEDGLLVMQLNGGGVYNSLANIPYELVFSIRNTYRGCYIVDCRYLVDGNLEVDILDDDAVKIVTFNDSYCWQYTYWAIEPDTLSDTVTEGIANAGYGSYTIAQVLYKQLSDKEFYYVITLTLSGSPDVVINIDSEGYFVPQLSNMSPQS